MVTRLDQSSYTVALMATCVAAELDQQLYTPGHMYILTFHADNSGTSFDRLANTWECFKHSTSPVFKTILGSIPKPPPCIQQVPGSVPTDITNIKIKN
jgi:hypothetical protein